MRAMSQLLLVLITALVTGVISISGIWVGSWLTRAGEDRKWRRDRCLEAYSEFLLTVELVKKECDVCYLTKQCGTEEHIKQSELVYHKMSEMTRLRLSIQLLAPRVVINCMWAITHQMGEIVKKSITCPKLERKDLDLEQGKSAEDITDFIYKARHDLGVDPPLDTIEGVREYYSNPWRRLWWWLLWLLRPLWR
jgi:hypothetical protein